MFDSEPLYGNIGVTVSSIKIEDLWDYVKQNKENDLDGFKREYKVSLLSHMKNLSSETMHLLDTFWFYLLHISVGYMMFKTIVLSEEWYYTNCNNLILYEGRYHIERQKQRIMNGDHLQFCYEYNTFMWNFCVLIGKRLTRLIMIFYNLLQQINEFLFRFKLLCVIFFCILRAQIKSYIFTVNTSRINSKM